MRLISTYPALCKQGLLFYRYLEGLLAAEQQESGIPQERVRLFGPPGCSHSMAAFTVSAILCFSQALMPAIPEVGCYLPPCKCRSVLAVSCAAGCDGLLSGWRHGFAQPQVPGKDCGSAGAEQLPGAGRGVPACPAASQRAVPQVHAHYHPHGLNALALRQLDHRCMQLPANCWCKEDS